MVTMNGRLGNARRIVAKIGSGLVVDTVSGKLRSQWLDSLVKDVARCRNRGQDVVLVSSGAIALGRSALGLPPGPLKLETYQAAAAAGQSRLAHAYAEALEKHGIDAAQILLTRDDTESRRRYLNASNTMATLLLLGAVPVINENDTVTTEEIRFGDNDRLAARVAQMVSADVLALLSDVDGLYTSDPAKGDGGELVREVSVITPEIEAMAGTARTDHGSGGMVTKISAARIANGAGCAVVLSKGYVEAPLEAVENGANCTWFLPTDTPRAARKNWIARGLTTQGTLILDYVAVQALHNGKSLLPAGVVAVEGAFQRGDAVIFKNPAGFEVGRGLCAYSLDDAQRILGHKSGEFEALLGYRGREEMVHRDDLVLSEERK
jgi:glutamate 5-kinase